MVLDRFKMAAVKRTAQNTKKLVARREKLNAQMRELAAELVSINQQIDAWETPIKVMTGGYTSEQVIAFNGEIPEEPCKANDEVVEDNESFNPEQND